MTITTRFALVVSLVGALLAPRAASAQRYYWDEMAPEPPSYDAIFFGDESIQRLFASAAASGICDSNGWHISYDADQLPYRITFPLPDGRFLTFERLHLGPEGWTAMYTMSEYLNGYLADTQTLLMQIAMGLDGAYIFLIGIDPTTGLSMGTAGVFGPYTVEDLGPFMNGAPPGTNFARVDSHTGLTRVYSSGGNFTVNSFGSCVSGCDVFGASVIQITPGMSWGITPNLYVPLGGGAWNFYRPMR